MIAEVSQAAVRLAPERLRLSELFQRYVRSVTASEVTLAEVTKALGERSLLVAIVLFSLPNCIPAPPGIGSIFALPVLIVAWQLFRGYPSLKLPGFIARRQVATRHLQWIATKGLRPLLWVERRCAPRLPGLVTHQAVHWLAIAFLVLATVVAFPGPGTNFLPAIAIVVVAVGVVEEDGLIVLSGLLFGIVAVIVATASTLAIFGGLYLGLDALFG